MSLNESIVEDAALEWFLLRQGSGGQVGELGFVVAPPACRDDCGAGRGEPAAERDSFGEVVLVGRLRAAIRRLNPVPPPSRTLATLRATLLPKWRSGVLSVAEFTGRMEASA